MAAPEITFADIVDMVDGGQILALSGTFSDDEGNDTATVTVAADLGAVTNVQQNNTAGTWSAAWTAPASMAASQDVTITATATDDNSDTDTAVRMTTVRALLALADFDDSGLDTNPALVLLVRGDASNGAAVWGRGSRAISGSSLLDGEIDLPPTDEPINQIRFRLDGSSQYGSEQISFHDDGPTALGPYFETGDGADLTLWVQSGTNAADIAEIPMSANYDRGGGNFAIFDVPSQFQSVVGSIDPGDRFILAMTRPSTNASPVVEFTTAAAVVNGNSVTVIEGTVSDDVDDDGDVVVTASTTLGTVSVPVNTNGNWSLNLTAVAATAAQQDMDVTVTATDMAGLSAVVSRTWTVRADLMPSLASVDDVTLGQGDALDLTLPTAIPPGDTPVTYSLTQTDGSAIPLWMTFVVSTLSLTGTTPNVDSTTSFRYTATDVDGDTAVRDFDVNVRGLLSIEHFNSAGLSAEALALFELGTRASNGAIWGRFPHTSRGTLLDGEFDIVNDTVPLTEVRVVSSGQIIQILRASGISLSEYFGSTGDGRDLTFWIQTGSGDDEIAEIVVADNTSSVGTSFLRLQVPQAFRSTLNALGNGDRVILAFTRESKLLEGSPALSGAVSVAGPLTKVAPGTTELEGSSMSSGAVSAAALLTKIEADAKLMTASPVSSGAVSAAALLTKIAPGTTELEGSSALSGAVSVAGPLTKVAPGITELEGSSVSSGAVSAAAALTKVAAGTKSIVADVAVLADVSVGRAVLSVLELMPKRIEAHPTVSVAASVSAHITKVIAGAQALIAGPSVSGLVSVVASLSKDTVSAKTLEAASSAIGSVTVSAELSKQSASEKLLEADASVTAIASASTAALSFVSVSPKDLMASRSLSGSLTIPTAVLMRRVATFKDFAGSSTFAGTVTVTAMVRKLMEIVPNNRPAREEFDVVDVTQYADLLISQYRSASRLRAFVEANLDIIQDEIIGPLSGLEYERHIDFAVGRWLDFIGIRLGLPRPNRLLTDTRFFGFGRGLDRGTFGEVPFYSRAAELEALLPLDDVWFWSLLRGRAIAIRSGTSAVDIEAVCNAVFSGGGYVVEGDRSVVVNVRDHREGFVPVVRRANVIPRPAGVRMTIVQF